MNEQRESMGDALRHLAADLTDLFRAEFALFKQEAGAQLRGLVTAGVWVAAAAVMGLAFLGAFTAFLIIALSLVLQPWLAALVVTVAWGFAAFSLLAAAAIKLKSTLPLEFDQTARSVKEDVEWMKSGIKSAK
jgi:hypothetical protein